MELTRLDDLKGLTQLDDMDGLIQLDAPIRMDWLRSTTWKDMPSSTIRNDWLNSTRRLGWIEPVRRLGRIDSAPPQQISNFSTFTTKINQKLVSPNFYKSKKQTKKWRKTICLALQHIVGIVMWRLRSCLSLGVLHFHSRKSKSKPVAAQQKIMS